MLFRSQTSSGSQELKGRFHSGKLRAASGDIEIAQASVTEDLAVETASGDVELTNVKARELRLCSASGDIQLERICAELLAIESRSGDLELQQVLAKEEFLCRSTSGDISLTGCDAPKMGFATVSGDITGSLLHGKRFSSRTVSGDIHLPGGTSEGECTISTVSGDANLRVEE